MVKDSTASTDEEVNTAAEGSSLIFNIDATVDGERVELVGMVLQLGQFVLNLLVKRTKGEKRNIIYKLYVALKMTESRITTTMETKFWPS